MNNLEESIITKDFISLLSGFEKMFKSFKKNDVLNTLKFISIGTEKRRGNFSDDIKKIITGINSSDVVLLDVCLAILELQSKDSEHKWVESDDWQFIKEYEFKNYEVYEMFKHPELEEFHVSYADIYYPDYHDELQTAINDSGYDSLLDLIQQCGSSSYQILAELFSEYETLENSVATFKTEEEALSYIFNKTGIKRDN